MKLRWKRDFHNLNFEALEARQMLCTTLAADADQNNIVTLTDRELWHESYLAQDLVGDFNGDGTTDPADLDVWRDEFGAMSTNDAPFVGQRLFDGKANRTRIGDLNNDGNDDVVAFDFEANTIRTAINDGQGRFASQYTRVASSITANFDFHLADLNSDGALDLLMTAYESDAVSIFEGNGLGQFESPLILDTGDGPRAIEVLDLGNDGIQDIVIANRLEDSISVFMGAGNFTYVEARYDTDRNPSAIESGDINQDGINDLLITHSSDSLYVLLGSADGFLEPRNALPQLRETFDVLAEDFDGDGIIDVVVAYEHDNVRQTGFSKGRGDGTFAEAASLVLAQGSSLKRGDFNGDGHTDIAVDNWFSVDILFGRGDGTFQQESIRIGERLGAIGDLNADGIDDILTNGLKVRFGLGNGSFGIAPNTDFGEGLELLEQIDFNADGRLDILARNEFDSTVVVLLATQTEGFIQKEPFSITGPIGHVTAADFDSDGFVDIASALYLADDLTILYGAGDGTFDAEQVVPFSRSANSVAADDFDNDGYMDLIVGGGTSRGVTIFFGSGDRVFDEANSLSLPEHARWIELLDFDNDGNSDLLFAHSFERSMSLYRGSSDGSFSPAATIDTEFSSRPLIVDLNKDSYPDLAILDVALDEVGVILGDGDGGFSIEKRFEVGDQPVDMATADLDGDGWPDLVTANQHSVDSTILFGTGTNDVFERITDFDSGLAGSKVMVDDFNRDGRVDYATANGSTLAYMLACPIVRPFNDLNGDGEVNADDIDTLSLAIQNGSSVSTFDINDDGLVSSADFDAFLNILGTTQGDANLDGVTDVTDFNIWNQNKFQANDPSLPGTGWSTGDFNTDGVTDVSDFNIWNENKFTSAYTLTPISSLTETRNEIVVSSGTISDHYKHISVWSSCIGSQISNIRSAEAERQTVDKEDKFVEGWHSTQVHRVEPQGSEECAVAPFRMTTDFNQPLSSYVKDLLAPNDSRLLDKLKEFAAST